MADQEIRVGVALGDNSAEVADRVAGGFDKMAAAAEKAAARQSAAAQKAEDRLKDIIARGDPLKELERQKEKELRLIDDLARKSVRAQQVAEEARTRVVAEHARRRNELEAKSSGRVSAGLESMSARFVGAAGAAMVLSKGLELIGDAARGTIDFLVASVRHASEAESQYASFAAALGPYAESVSTLADAIERKTGADADDLRQTAAVMASYGLTTEQIRRGLPALQAYADVTGKDLPAARKLLEKAIAHGMVEESLAMFEGFLVAGNAKAATFSGSTRRLATDFGNLQEAIGDSTIKSQALVTTLDIADELIRRTTGGSSSLGTVLGDTLAGGASLAAGSFGVLTHFLAPLPRMIADFIRVSTVGARVLAELPGPAGAPFRAIMAVADGVNEQLDAATERMKETGDEAFTIAARINQATGEIRKIDVPEDRVETAFGGHAGGHGRGKGGKGGKGKDREEAVETDLDKLDDQLRKNRALREQQTEEIEEDLAHIDELLAASGARQSRERAKAFGDNAKFLTEFRAKVQEGNARLTQTMADWGRKTTELWGQFGVTAAGAFAQGLKRYFDSKDPKDIFGGLLQVAGPLMSILLAGTGFGFLAGVPGIVGAFLEEGGYPHALAIPQGRGGLGVLPHVNNDARPAFLHDGEVVPRKEVVQRDFGSLTAATAWAQGRAPLPAAGPPQKTTVIVQAFTPRQAAEGVADFVAPGMTQRLQAGQSGELRGAIRDAARVRRWH